MSRHAKQVEIDDKTKLALLAVGEAVAPALREFRIRWLLECKKRGIKPAIATAACIDYMMIPLIRQVFLASGLPLNTANEIDADFYQALLMEVQELIMNSVGDKIELIQKRIAEGN